MYAKRACRLYRWQSYFIAANNNRTNATKSRTVLCSLSLYESSTADASLIKTNTPSTHRRRCVTAVLVRPNPHSHRHDRRGSAVVPSLIAVAPRKTVKTADLRGGTADTLNMFKTFAVPPRVGPTAVGSPRHRHDRRGAYKDRSCTYITAVPPQYNPCNLGGPTAIPWPFNCGYGGATTVLLHQPCSGTHWLRNAAANTAVLPPMIAVAPPSNC